MAKFLQKAAETRKRVREEEEAPITLQKTESRSSSRTSSKKPTTSTTTSTSTENSNIVYLGHIPEGFYEKEMNAFFRQFGTVLHLKLFRSAKTNKSKGYAFIQFETADIAEVVADAMDGYFIQNKQFVANVLPLNKVHPGMFTSKKRVVAPKTAAVAVVDEEKAVDLVKHAAALRKKQKKLDELGIKFSISGESFTK